MFGIWTNSRQLVCTARQKREVKETAYSSSQLYCGSFFKPALYLVKAAMWYFCSAFQDFQDLNLFLPFILKLMDLQCGFSGRICLFQEILFCLICIHSSFLLAVWGLGGLIITSEIILELNPDEIKHTREIVENL